MSAANRDPGGGRSRRGQIQLAARHLDRSAAVSGGPRHIIQAKLEPPEPATHWTDRPRLDARLAEALANGTAVWVCATAGAGKTTAVAAALRGQETPHAWLTLGDTDVAPGRLLSYLEAAIASVVPELDGTLASSLCDGFSHAEAAEALARAVRDTPLILAVDEVERIAGCEPAVAVINGFLAGAPADVKLVLVGRVEFPLRVGRDADGRVQRIGERELAFTTGEAAAALANAGHGEIDPMAAVRATSGWVTGVMFEAWACEAHVPGAGGEVDPLHGYLSQEILQRLGPAEREFLIRTSVLDEVDARLGRALGEADAEARLELLRGSRLPAVWSADGRSLRLHTRFREYLTDCLKRRGTTENRRLRASLARIHAANGHVEDAVDQFLAAGELDAACALATDAIERVIERSDFTIADRWLAAFDRATIERNPRLWKAELKSATGQLQYERGAALGRRLRRRADRPLASSSDWEPIFLLAWCYQHVCRPDEMRQLLIDHAERPEVAEAARILGAVCERNVDWELPETTHSTLDILLVRARYIRGELPQVRALAHRNSDSRWSRLLVDTHEIAALRAAGLTSHALLRYERFLAAGHSAVWLQSVVYIEILADLGRLDEAREALRRGNRMIYETGSRMLRSMSMLVEARIELRLAGDPRRAIAILDELDRAPEGRAYAFIAEAIDCWYGQALLMLGRDEEALERLSDAVASMIAGRRRLELPTAAVALSEAWWRADEERAADRAADLALKACDHLGSRHPLLQALTDHPTVAARRCDAEPDPDSAWHDLWRTLLRPPSPVQIESIPAVALHDFGRVRLTVNGAEIKLPLKKSYELFAYLVATGREQVTREELLDALFDARNDDASRAYLRRAIVGLRDAFAGELEVTTAGSTIRVRWDAAVLSDADRFEALLQEAARVVGSDRLVLLQRALRLYDGGSYLAGVESEWVKRRRDGLRERGTDALLLAAEQQLETGGHREAAALAEAALAADPFRERGWQLLMRAAAAHGDRDAVRDALSRCGAALRALGIEPSISTRSLAIQLQAVDAPDRARLARR